MKTQNTIDKKFIRTLKGEVNDIPPVWLMRQAGRYLPEYLETRAKAGSFLDLCYNPDLAAEVTLQPIRRFGFDASILFSDILTIPHALGQELTFAENHGPLLGELPKTLEFKESVFHVNLLPVYETVAKIREGLTREGFTQTALIGFSGAPWTLACYMIDRKGSKEFAATRVMALQDPEKFAALIDTLVIAITAYLKKQIEYGAEVIQIFDSWAGVLPPAEFRKWVIEPTARIIKSIKADYPDIPVIGFPKGAGPLYPEYAANTGITALGIDTQTPVEWVKTAINPAMPVQGNLDPFTLVAGGKALDAAVDTILENWAGRPYIFNLGHGIDKSTPITHVEALLKRIRT